MAENHCIQEQSCSQITSDFLINDMNITDERPAGSLPWNEGKPASCARIFACDIQWFGSSNTRWSRSSNGRNYCREFHAGAQLLYSTSVQLGFRLQPWGVPAEDVDIEWNPKRVTSMQVWEELGEPQGSRVQLPPSQQNQGLPPLVLLRLVGRRLVHPSPGEWFVQWARCDQILAYDVPELLLETVLSGAPGPVRPGCCKVSGSRQFCVVLDWRPPNSRQHLSRWQ